MKCNGFEGTNRLTDSKKKKTTGQQQGAFASNISALEHKVCAAAFCQSPTSAVELSMNL
jgi:hypothetical protein